MDIVADSVLRGWGIDRLRRVSKDMAWSRCERGMEIMGEVTGVSSGVWLAKG